MPWLYSTLVYNISIKNDDCFQLLLFNDLILGNMKMFKIVFCISLYELRFKFFSKNWIHFQISLLFPRYTSKVSNGQKLFQHIILENSKDHTIIRLFDW